jgi:glycosyltransferase involved in cell wall biosynthesis
VHRLRTRFIKIGRRVFPIHVGLVAALRTFEPDVVLCEGESHFLGYLQAAWYRMWFHKRVGLMHWCFISLPGEPLRKKGLAGIVKAYTRKLFDAFVLYSSYSKECLVKLGIPTEKIFVATNVGDVKKFLNISNAIPMSRAEARRNLSINDRFTVLYAGTLDRNKKPDLLLDLAAVCDHEKFNFVLLGGGEMLIELQKRAADEGLANVYLPGKVGDSLGLYYRASDVLLVPGRGGIVISEGMAFGLPIVTFQADGTEYDLIRDKESGFILTLGDSSDFRNAIEILQQDKELASQMGRSGRLMVEQEFTTDNMVRQIIKAAEYAREHARAK